MYGFYPFGAAPGRKPGYRVGVAARSAALLDALASEAMSCRNCPLWENATQTVFGEGPAGARMVLVGEQPWDKEDLSGHPFVGPAGRVLDEALQTAGIERAEVYMTNAVKHFKFRPSGKRRIHDKPNRQEVLACRPWLEKELEFLEAARGARCGPGEAGRGPRDGRSLPGFRLTKTGRRRLSRVVRAPGRSHDRPPGRPTPPRGSTSGAWPDRPARSSAGASAPSPRHG